MTQEHRPYNKTRFTIIQAMLTSENPLTRTQIAQLLNRKKTPHLINILNNLVDEGILIRDVKTFHNGVQGYTYHLNPDPAVYADQLEQHQNNNASESSYAGDI